MRKINKGEPLDAFVKFKNKNPSANWSDFHEKAHDVYVDTREHILFNEQNCMCGYTEMPINEFTEARLDHYLKRALFPKETFTWNNLVAVLDNSDFGDHYKDTVYRIKKDEYGLIFNPVEDAVEDYFEYNQRGEIEPKQDLDAVLKVKVEKTVQIFNLEHETLRKRRENIIRQIMAYSDLPKDDIRKILRPLGFLSVINQFTQ